MDAIVKRLTAQGYSESRARRIASKQVPLVQEQTQSSESLVDLVTGATAKREAEDAKFRKDLDQLAKPSK
ncbi:hypothetical protein DB347_23705 [Opitutaceae bacterium EW11]|nr:hypothetical protein DB347_23705 [Opitutaceae bacterium EW11]